MIVLIIVVVSAIVIAKLYPEPSCTVADPALIAEANRINALITNDTTNDYTEAFKPSPETPSATLSPFSFDPNLVTAAQLQQMKLPDATIKSLLGYRSKGGVFRKPEDIQKLYGLSQELSFQLIPYITISDSFKRKEYNSKLPSKYDTLLAFNRYPIEINTADSASLVFLKGVGPILAQKIIAYRNRLGGYFNTDQLLDIYGLSSETILQIKDQIIVDSTRIVRWSVNKLPVDSMAKHPYLSRYQANAIVFYRGKVGAIRTIDELVHNRILPPEVARKLRPYVKF